MTAKHSVDEYLGRRYVVNEYNCFHFVAEVWQDLCGQDVIKLFGDAVIEGAKSSKLSRRLVKGFSYLDKPEDPCFVMFRNRGQSPHIGIYLRGRVLHIRYNMGVRHEPLHMAQFGFTHTRFFKPC